MKQQEKPQKVAVLAIFVAWTKVIHFYMIKRWMHNIYMAYDQVVIKKLFKSKTHLLIVCEKMKKLN